MYACMEEVQGEYPESLEDVLKRLRRIDGIEAVTLARDDGLAVAHQLPNWLDSNRMAAMAAVLLGVGTRVAEELRKGELRQCWLQCKEGMVIAIRTSGGTILIALLGEEANVGLVLTALETAALELAQVLESLLKVAIA